RGTPRSPLGAKWGRAFPTVAAVSYENAGVTFIQPQLRPADKPRSLSVRVAAVVLAAGGSTRFGKPKQLATFRGETFVRHIVAATVEAGCAPVVVVVGADAAQITLELNGLAALIVM